MTPAERAELEELRASVAALDERLRQLESLRPTIREAFQDTVLLGLTYSQIVHSRVTSFGDAEKLKAEVDEFLASLTAALRTIAPVAGDKGGSNVG